MNERDELYRGTADLVDFAFDARVTGVFADMIRRSVPGYDNLLAIGALLGAEHVPPGGRVYDLGCSRGASIHALRRCIAHDDWTAIGVDSSETMIAAARTDLARDPSRHGPRLELVHADLRDVALHQADLVVLNFTLQFVPRDDRLALLQRIRAALRGSGALLLADKVHHADPALHAARTRWHEAFKRANGYSEMEVAAKRSAIEGVLVTDSQQEHLARLRAAGFRTSTVWMRCLNFVGILALP